MSSVEDEGQDRRGQPSLPTPRHPVTDVQTRPQGATTTDIHYSHQTTRKVRFNRVLVVGEGREWPHRGYPFVSVSTYLLFESHSRLLLQVDRSGLWVVCLVFVLYLFICYLFTVRGALCKRRRRSVWMLTVHTIYFYSLRV